MLWQAISVQIDGAGSSETAVATFDGIAILTPRWENLTAELSSFLNMLVLLK